jgi:hypothetical protein
LPTTRPRRYPSDTSDAEWEIIAPYIPVGGTTSKGGAPLTNSRRDIVDAIRYIDHTSCQWRSLAALTSFCEFHARHGVDLAGLLVRMQPAGRRGSPSSSSRLLLTQLLVSLTQRPGQQPVAVLVRHP